MLANLDFAKPPPSPAVKKMSLAEGVKQISKLNEENIEQNNDKPLQQQNHDTFISRNQKL